MRPDREELECIVSLLDDRDESVVRMVDDYILRKGVPAVEFVRAALPEIETPENRAFLKERMEALLSRHVLNLFRDEKDSGFPSVTEGLFLLSQLCQPELRRSEFDALYMDMVTDALREIRPAQTAMEQVSILNHIIFVRHQLKVIDRGREDVAEPPFVNTILDRHAGAPVPVAIVYFLIARFVELPLYPVLTQDGGFSIGYFEKGEPLLFVNITAETPRMCSREEFFQDLEKENAALDLKKKFTADLGDKVILEIYNELLMAYQWTRQNRVKFNQLARAGKMLGVGRIL